jgi:hypothetical protein
MNELPSCCRTNVVLGLLVPIPNLPLTLSQNKFALSLTTFPVPSNNTRPTVPEVIAVVPMVIPVDIVNVLSADRSCVVPFIVRVRDVGTLPFNAVCKSVCEDSVPVIVPHVVTDDGTESIIS